MGVGVCRLAGLPTAVVQFDTEAAQGRLTFQSKTN